MSTVVVGVCLKEPGVQWGEKKKKECGGWVNMLISISSPALYIQAEHTHTCLLGVLVYAGSLFIDVGQGRDYK